MRALTINDVNPFYRKRYWDTIKGDDLPMGVDYAVFDFEINSGGRAAKTLQSLLGVTADGQIGPATVAAAQAADASSIIAGICETRLNYLKTLSDWDRYGNGWANRIERVQDIATKMVG
jgi:lysozyme family protein